MPEPRRRRPEPRLRLAALLGIVAIVLAACGSAGASFSPTGACTADGRAAGAYPSLEAAVPHAIAGRAATTVDSGRNCSPDALGTFTSHDVHELDFAGATWDEGNGSGVSIAVLRVPDKALPATWAEEFYTFGAANGKHTGNLETSHPTYPGVGKVFRLDTLNDLSFQTVVVWPDGDLVRVVIVATQVGPTASRTVHDARVAEAVGAAALVSQPSPGCGCTSTPVLPSAA